MAETSRLSISSLRSELKKVNQEKGLEEFDIMSVRTLEHLKNQADILARIADVKMDHYMSKAPESIRNLHDKGVPKHVFFGVGGTAFSILVFFIVLQYGFQMLSVFVSVLQPLYYTYYALESTQKDDDTEWLTYWMVHGVLGLLEHTLLVPIVVFFPAVYFVGKIVLQIWMLNFGGSMLLYKRFLAPTLRRHEKQLEAAIEMAKKEALATAGIRLPHPHKDEIAEQDEEAERKQSLQEGERYI